ncbi:MAG: hypothetical protein JEZ14_00985 [Marinilabiliaceae bacterium]|nr:hypothetical protein [Marinilabiliaceae bacterium]
MNAIRKISFVSLMITISLVYFYGESQLAQETYLDELANLAMADIENGSGYPGYVPCFLEYQSPAWFVNDHDFIYCLSCSWVRGHDLMMQSTCAKP